MVDGVSGTELMGQLFTTDPDPHEVHAADDAEFVPHTRRPLQLAADAIVDLLASPRDQWRAVPRSTIRRPARHRHRRHRFRESSGPTQRRRLLNGPVGPNRRYAFDYRSLDDIHTIRQAFGGTINDVVLAAAANGFRELLLSRGEPVDGRVIRTLIPVATHARDAHGTAIGDGHIGNRVSGLFAELPVGISDPVARLANITEQLHHLKGSGHAEAGSVLTVLSERSPDALFALGVRANARARQANINTTVTNVPGPRVPLYMLGRTVTRIYAYPPPFPVGARTAIGVYSYGGNVQFGVTGDYSSVPDVDVICDGMQDGFTAILAAANDAAHRTLTPDCINAAFVHPLTATLPGDLTGRTRRSYPPIQKAHCLDHNASAIAAADPDRRARGGADLSGVRCSSPPGLPGSAV
jgi:WS/DGAT/MGAT family acyltransferase